MCKRSDFETLRLDEIHRAIVMRELDMWHEKYLPCGKNVLDIGAGCGETALFYLNHGAERVVCIEGDNKALTHLHWNFSNDPRVKIVPLLIDHIKIDVDGAEEGMLLETHSPASFFEPIWRDGNSSTILWKLNHLAKLTM